MMTILIYEGIAAEDSPIDRQSGGDRQADHVGREERAAVHALLKLHRHSRRHSPDPSHHQRADHRKAPGKQRGVERPLAFPNTMEFSISGNIGAQLFGGYRRAEPADLSGVFRRGGQRPASSRIRFCTAPCASTAGKSSRQSRPFSGNGNVQGMPLGQGSLHDIPAMGGDRRRGHGRQRPGRPVSAVQRRHGSTCPGTAGPRQ